MSPKRSACSRELGDRSLWRGLPGLTFARVLRVLLPWTHASIRFRERARMKQALLYSRCRRIALAIGETSSVARVLESRDDVFFLTVTEIDELLSGAAMFPRDVRNVVRVRRRAHERLAATTPPDAFTLAEGEYLDAVRCGSGGRTGRECRGVSRNVGVRRTRHWPRDGAARRHRGGAARRVATFLSRGRLIPAGVQCSFSSPVW